MTKIITIIVLIIAGYTTTLAQTVNCPGTGTPRAEGLSTTPQLDGVFNTTSGACIIDPKTAFAPFKIPTFDDLKSLYYTQK